MSEKERATHVRAKMRWWVHPIRINLGWHDGYHCWRGYECSQLIVLEITQPLVAEVVAVRVSGEQNLREGDDPLDDLLLVHHGLCWPQPGFDKANDCREKIIIFRAFGEKKGAFLERDQR